jgi:hypothetical protein
VTGTGSDLGKSYVAFVRGNMDQIAKKISDDLLVLSTMEVREKARPFCIRKSNFERKHEDLFSLLKKIQRQYFLSG